MSSYDELLKQVESLKLENSHLHRELQDNSSHLTQLENDASTMKDVFTHAQTIQEDGEYCYGDETVRREHMAMAEGIEVTNFEDGSEQSDSRLDSESCKSWVAGGNPRGHERSQSPVPSSGSHGDTNREREKEILTRLQQLDHERTSLVRELESEDKNRKWYYDQIEMIQRKIRSLPVTDSYGKQQPGLTRKHLDFEISRLRETMHECFGTNEHIAQRKDCRIQRIRQVDGEMAALQQQREQLEQERDQLALRQQDRPDQTSDLEQTYEEDEDHVTMATQTLDEEQAGDTTLGPHNISAMYHGAWPIGKDMSHDREGSLQSLGHQDVSSVMSFNSANTSSTHSSGGLQGRRQQQQQQAPAHHNQQQQAGQQQPPQMGSKVEMVYSLLSMLGTHDKDDMSRTLLAMSSSQDSCIAMRQSGCMPLLIQLLHGSDKDSALLGNTRGSKPARARASAAMHNIVHSHPDDKRGRREARVLRLLEQVRAHCDQLHDTHTDEDGGSERRVTSEMDHHPGPAIATLMKLSFDEEHRHAICTLGGLHAIAELLQVDHEVNGNTTEQYNITMRRYGCMALTNLTFGDGTNKALLCSMKPSMLALVSQLTNSNEDLCQVAASVLRNLSWKADLASKKTLREEGAVTMLMEASMIVGKETTLKSILSALWNLSAHCSENKADICAVCGALEFLVGTLTYKSPSKTTSIIENGGGILRNVSSHIAVREEYRKVLRQHGCMQILLKHLRSPSLTIVSNACGTLWNLSARCAEDQQALWDMGAVNMLRNLVHSKHKMISMGSSAALKNLLAARPAMKHLELNKQANLNRPTLHVRKQRALEADIDQNLAETCENVESPRDSPIEGTKSDNKDTSTHFVYPIYPVSDSEPRRSLMRGQFFPRSQSGDNSLAIENRVKSQRVARSGSQDSVGSTHSDISNDRSRSLSSGPSKGARNASQIGGSLDRNKEPVPRHGQNLLFSSDGGSERNPLGSAPNSRILQVMQEVADNAGIQDQKSQDSKDDSANFKVPHSLPGSMYKHPLFSSKLTNPHASYPPLHHMTPQQVAIYHRLVMNKNLHERSQAEQQHSDSSDEKPLDFSAKYSETGPSQKSDFQSRVPLPQPLVGNFVGGGQFVHNQQNRNTANNQFYNQQQQYQDNSAYAETDLDDPDQPTDYSARYGAEYVDNYSEQPMNYGARYDERDPNCADCKLEEARRRNDEIEQTINDQVTMFCTEGTPFLSTATSMTDLSTAVKILEEAQEHCNENGDEFCDESDEIQNYSNKYGETGQVVNVQKMSDADNRSESQITDQHTGTTIIPNYNIDPSKSKANLSEKQPSFDEEPEERSFHNTCDDNAPMDQTKTYCEEGTPVCFSRVSSLSSLHSSEAADRIEKSRPQGIGPLQSIEETDDMNSTIVKMATPSMTPLTMRQKTDADTSDNSEREHKTVTFEDKAEVQETPMMFSRCTSLGSLSSFDAQSVHSEVVSEYSRRASEVVSPSELPDSPSETMPPSPKRTKSPDMSNQSQLHGTFSRTGPPQFTSKANDNIQRVNPVGVPASLVNLSLQFNNMNIHSNMNMQMKDQDTGSLSSKMEVPVVYADEGTPPIFLDNMSELSAITMDKHDVTVTVTHSSHGNKNSGVHDANNCTTSANQIELSKKSGDNFTANKTQEKIKVQVKTDRVIAAEPIRHGEVKAETSESDCEGDEDILANIISSAMPLSSRKIKKSSSDNSMKKRSGNSSKSNSGTSSQSKTPVKTPVKTSSEHSIKASGIPKPTKSVKRSLQLPPKHPTHSNNTESEDTVKSYSLEDMPYNIPRSHTNMTKPLNVAQHRDVARLSEQIAPLDLSTDSVRSFADEDAPFNTSNVQSVINTPFNTSKVESVLNRSDGKPLAQSKLAFGPKQKSPIIQRAEDLHSLDIDEDTVKSYATEDTPFTSIPSSPKHNQKFFPIPTMDLNQDSVKSYATEDTPYSGSVPVSPKMEKRFSHIPPPDLTEDSIKSYATEDTPGTSPKKDKASKTSKLIDRNPAANRTSMTQNQNIYRRNVPSQSKKPPLQGQVITNQQQLFQNKPNLNQELPALDMNEDAIKTFATEDTPFSGSGLSSPKPQVAPKFNHHLMGNIDCISNNYDHPDDLPKVFATEGTPLNFSNAGSFSDLSSIGTNLKADAYPQENPTSLTQQKAIDVNAETSSSTDDGEDLLSEVIQSAMPMKSSKSRRSMDRKPEGAESKRKSSSSKTGGSSAKQAKTSNQKDKEKGFTFKPQRTSSLAKPEDRSSYVSQNRNTSEGSDQVKSYAVEGTPINFSTGTSLSDLTIDSMSAIREDINSEAFGPVKSSDISNINSSIAATYGTSNDSVFLHSDTAEHDSMKNYCVEDTPQTFSRNDSLSSLSIMTEDSKGSVSEQIKVIAMAISHKTNQSESKPIIYQEQADVCEQPNSNNTPAARMSDTQPPSDGQEYFNSNQVFDRQVTGQSSESSQSVSDTSRPIKRLDDEVKNFGVEDTPLSFSRSSSLSSIHNLDENHDSRHKSDKPDKPKDNVAVKHATKDQQSSYKVEDTPVCFSRNSSLSSLSVHSDDSDENPEDAALLDELVSSALPPRTRSNRDERRRSGHHTRADPVGSRHSKTSESDDKLRRILSHNYASADEAESESTHPSRYSNWRKEPQKSCDEIFLKPSMDAKGRPCRRSRSQDNEKILKQNKDISNKELAQQYGVASGNPIVYRGSLDSLPKTESSSIKKQRFVNENEVHRQQIISESQNLTRSIENRVRELTGSIEKTDEHEHEKDQMESPEDEPNFFMTCSGLTEISVESISKLSFPSSMAPDHFTDDDILDDSMVGSFGGDGAEESRMPYGVNSYQSNDTTLTEQPTTDRNSMPDNMITSSEMLDLSANANLIMSELAVNQTMTMSGMTCSLVDDDRFIENETLSLVSNDYTSDTASEASVTWSVSSGRNSELSEATINAEGGSPSMRRPRIVKPADGSEACEVYEENKGIRGRRKPLYSNKPKVAAQPSPQMNNSQGKARKPNTNGRDIQNITAEPASKKQLRTVPQACSTPVKTNNIKSRLDKSTKPSPLQRSASLNQNVQITKAQLAQQNIESETNAAENNTSKSKVNTSKHKAPMKQGTFVKESAKSNATVDVNANISFDDNADVTNSYGVNMRKKKKSDSSLNRNSSGSSNNSSRLSAGSTGSAQDSWSKALNSYNFILGQDDRNATNIPEVPQKEKQNVTSSKPARKNLNNIGSLPTKIPSPSRAVLNKSGSSGHLRKTNSGSPLAKSNSGSGLVKTGSNSSLKKQGSNTSLKNNSRPSTPVRKGSDSSNGSSMGKTTADQAKPKQTKQGGNSRNKKPSNKAAIIRKKSDNDLTINSISKLPVANVSKVSKSENVQAIVEPQQRKKRELSPRPAGNRATFILSDEGVVEGLSRSSTYDKLITTNEHSRVPSHDTDSDSEINSERPVIDPSEIGIEYNLDDAWSMSVERSIEVMSKSIEDSKNQKDSFYTDDLDISKMDLTESPAKRLSKSGSMSEIEVEFSRNKSGTWSKKPSRNDFSMLPDAEDTCRTLPLKKRSGSVEFASKSRIARSDSECLMKMYEVDFNDDVWIKQDSLKRDANMSTKSKKRSFGSSSLLPIKNVVTKVFGSNKSSKKSPDVQSKSFSVPDKEFKRPDLNRTSIKLSKKQREEDDKRRKELLKQAKAELKAEQKQAKADQKATKIEAKSNKNNDSKLNRSESKKSKQESKLKKSETKAKKSEGKFDRKEDKSCKSEKSKKIMNPKVNLNQELSSSCSSTSSLKKSASALVDIDKDLEDDDSDILALNVQNLQLDQSQTVTQIVHKSPEPTRSQSQNSGILVQEIKTSPQAKVQPFNYNPNPRGIKTEIFPETDNCSNSQAVIEKSIPASPIATHLTKTEMLLARRQNSMLSSSRSTETSENEDDGKKKKVETTV